MRKMLPPGTRVRVRALKLEGSARLLHGLTGTVLGPHPIATGWVRIQLDPNAVTPHLEWPIAIDRLVCEKPQTNRKRSEI